MTHIEYNDKRTFAHHFLPENGQLRIERGRSAMVVPSGPPSAPSSSATPMGGAHPGVHNARDGAGHRGTSSGAVRLRPATPR